MNRQVVSGQEATLTGLNPREAYSVSVTSQYGSAELCGFPSGTVQQECRTGTNNFDMFLRTVNFWGIGMISLEIRKALVEGGLN